jgi:hypothetical protein
VGTTLPPLGVGGAQGTRAEEELRCKVYAERLLTHTPTLYRSYRLPAERGVTLSGGPSFALVSIIAWDTCADMTLITLELFNQLGIKLRPSLITVKQSGGGGYSKVAGVPDRPITIILHKGTPQEMRIPLYRVVVMDMIGAQCDLLVGTEVLNAMGMKLWVRPPMATLSFYPEGLSHDNWDLEGVFPLSVFAAQPMARVMLTEGEFTCCVTSRGADRGTAGQQQLGH